MASAALRRRAFGGLHGVGSSLFHSVASPTYGAIAKVVLCFCFPLLLGSSPFQVRSVSLFGLEPYGCGSSFSLLSLLRRGLFRHLSFTTSSGTEAASVVLPATTSEPVVSVDWLMVLDASWYLPNEQRNPLQEYQVAHIPGALFFDIDGISDKNSNLPHMLPSEEAFAAAVSALGICNKDGWMFRAFGHDKVWVLDGGLPRWRAVGYDVESSASGDAILKASAASEAIEKVYQGRPVGLATFQAKLQLHLVWTLEQVQKNIHEQTYQHIDARSKSRFDGVAPEPRKGIRAGHVPGSRCIPFGQVLDSSQVLLPRSELQKKFEDKGKNSLWGLHRLGKADVPVYDGSWTEWASKPDTPVTTS
ncbi:unnamed protein product [Spirodela intermedia]|uniref:Sulfurtransferase n=1 Tax=Spirodela intermedia TaxID=51605 RepID=A0A7I8JKH0_SPIIN|nr:unnamed protein product [Spirodela intermedia]CAA6669942.1 unnamed protein product [Spirodela intermedia]